jgi:hypothetical protein
VRVIVEALVSGTARIAIALIFCNYYSVVPGYSLSLKTLLLTSKFGFKWILKKTSSDDSSSFVHYRRGIEEFSDGRSSNSFDPTGNSLLFIRKVGGW